MRWPRLLLSVSGILVTSPVLAQSAPDPADQAFRQAALARAWTAPLGARESWSNPVSDHSGVFTPLRDNRTNPNQTCRELSESVVAAGQAHDSVSVFCRGADQTWRLVQSAPMAGSDSGIETAASKPLPADLAPANIDAGGPQSQPASPYPITIRVNRNTTPNTTTPNTTVPGATNTPGTASASKR